MIRNTDFSLSNKLDERQRNRMLNDLVQPNLKLVICGTAAGKTSGHSGFYYAKPGNKFWKTLFEIGLTPRELQPSEYERLVDFGIGLTDIVKGQSGMDKQINFAATDHDLFHAKITRYHPEIICFNGKKAAETLLRRKVGYGQQPQKIGEIQLFVAPSTSGAANGSWDVEIWKELGHIVSKRTD